MAVSELEQATHPGGRPLQLDERTITAICTLIRAGGLRPRAAARAVGVSERTWQNWVLGAHRKTRNQGRYRELAAAVADAQREHEFALQRLVARCRAHALGAEVRRAPRPPL